MKIVFLDAATMGKEISLEKIEECGEFVSYENSSESDVLEKIRDAEVIITNRIRIFKREFDAAKKLKLICAAATGYNHIDIDEARERGIVVCNVEGYSTDSVAQMTFAYLLEIMTSLSKYCLGVRSGEWRADNIKNLIAHPINELKGKSLGIVGYGNIGKKISEIAKAFGMEVLVAKRPGVEYKEGGRVEFEEVLKRSDIITFHIPLTKESEGMIREEEFALMKDGVIILNSARGGIIDEDALYENLKTNKVRAAAVDVVKKEPIEIDDNLLELSNIYITPHIAWASVESRETLIKRISENILDYQYGGMDKINLCKTLLK